MKKLLFMLCLIVPLMFTGCDKSSKNDTNMNEETVKVFNDKVVEQVIIQNHNIAYYDNVSHVALTILNENNSETNAQKLKINYYRDNVLVYSVTKNVGMIKANESYTLTLLSDLNLATCDKVKYEIVK